MDRRSADQVALSGRHVDPCHGGELPGRFDAFDNKLRIDLAGEFDQDDLALRGPADLYRSGISLNNPHLSYFAP
ncbi:hypothetical protein ACFRJ8_04155 [Arthrobacter sp. NPDC056886]|uniref:hypothetical protein n=1 Tax=Arthrobacter sp. NPDC056886 TaxID=3345960 RepID=UPI00366C2459